MMMGFDISGLGNLDGPDVTIKGTHFRIGKLLPMEAYQVMEMIREALGSSMGSTAAIEGEQSADAIFRSLLSLPPSKVEAIRQRLFQLVTYTNAQQQTPAKLAGDEDGGFNGLLPSHVYEVLLRCLVRNFRESLEDFLSRILSQPESSSSPATET